MPKQVIIADSTQIDTYCTCPTLWNYEFKENLALDAEIKDDIKMGTLGHKWMERFYQVRALSSDLNKAIEYANAFDPDAADEADNHEYPLDPKKRKTVIDRCQLYWMKYSKLKDFVPLVKTVEKWGWDEQGYPITIHEKVPLVEQGFSYELLNTPEFHFILEGRIDILTEVNRINHWVDHKFQTRERSLYSKSIQFRNYCLATNCQLGVINYIRLHQEVKTTTLERQIVSFSPIELRVWKSELIDIFRQMARDVKNEEKNGSYAFERRRSSCPGKFGYQCQFTHICEEPNLQIGDLIKVEKYKKKKEWKPW